GPFHAPGPSTVPVRHPGTPRGRPDGPDRQTPCGTGPGNPKTAQMTEIKLLLAVLAGIALILFLILKLRIHAFISLLIGSISVGWLAGLDAGEIMATVQNGMGGTLGFVATVVGLGAIFGGILETSGGAKAIADYMVSKFGLGKSPLAMVISGFVIAIPVFF